MSIEGSINVSALFHDKAGTTTLKVVSLRSATEYTTGKVGIFSGTAGTAATVIGLISEVPSYLDAEGNAVSFSNVLRVGFAWSGTALRKLSDTADNAFVLGSMNGQMAVTNAVTPGIDLTLGGGAGSGTYTIVLYGS